MVESGKARKAETGGLLCALPLRIIKVRIEMLAEVLSGFRYRQVDPWRSRTTDNYGKRRRARPLACRRRREKLSTLQLTLQPNYGFAGESTGRDVRPACLTCPNIIEDQVVSKEKDITGQFINDLSKH